MRLWRFAAWHACLIWICHCNALHLCWRRCWIWWTRVRWYSTHIFVTQFYSSRNEWLIAISSAHRRGNRDSDREEELHAVNKNINYIRWRMRRSNLKLIFDEKFSLFTEIMCRFARFSNWIECAMIDWLQRRDDNSRWCNRKIKMCIHKWNLVRCSLFTRCAVVEMIDGFGQIIVMV